MIHNFEVMAGTLASAVVGHLALWEGWAVLIAAALFGWRAAAWWMPIPIALIINPEPFGLVTGLIHGRHPNFFASALFTLGQLLLAYLGFLAGRLVKRFR